ncbi:PRC-barrel domain containing protein [Streptacidiphilus pinicola]|uniref:PRC-barrel domain containing protein n=1 Tax=Streptacidiphilus pinicola TaxID=2219663 RepID=A0A2X0I8T1_9ACTN|nr:PRC-barrel domain containing protein [Streptacidiphilus pinicola]RAG80897.1 PRC-barrel domain containing protein [Streptacidiphilus pinicola]
MSGTPSPPAQWLFHCELEDFPGLGSLTTYTVHAEDGRLGTVLRTVDEPGTGLLLVNTGPWIFGRLLAVPAGLIAEVDRDAETLRVAGTRKHLRRAPEYLADTPDAFADYRTKAADYFSPVGLARRLTP